MLRTATICACRILHIGLIFFARGERHVWHLLSRFKKQWGRMQVAKKDWMESVQLVFDYFCERTPR